MFLEPGVCIVATRDGFDVIAFGIKVVAKKRGQRFFIFDNKNSGAHARSFS